MQRLIELRNLGAVSCSLWGGAWVLVHAESKALLGVWSERA